MAMYKAAQFMDDLAVELPIQEEMPSDEVILLVSPEASDEQMEVSMEPQEEELSFKLPFLPGAPDIEAHEEELDVSEDDKKDEDKKDKSKAELTEDLTHIKEYLNKIPKHKGETIALERAKSYLNRGLAMLSKMVQQDFDGKLDISKAEDARVEMEDGIGRLEKELARRKKAQDEKNGIVKEGQKIGGVISGGVMVTVPLKISRIARVCINATVSGGKDMEDMVHRQSDKWKLDDNEKADLIQLIQDMGYAYINRDMGFMVDDKEKFNPRSSHNYSYPAVFQS